MSRGLIRRQYAWVFLASLLIGAQLFAQQPAVPFISGGVGETDRAAMERAEGSYNLKLVFTGEEGIYLSGVDVRIRDASGMERLHATSEGPILLADVPAGMYTVEVTAEGKSLSRKVVVDKSMKTQHFRFPIRG